MYESTRILKFMIVSETYAIEDCIYYNTTEKTHTSLRSSTIYDSNMSVALPTNCEISYDLWSNNTNNSSEFRYFVLPKAQTSTGTTQPTYALFCDALYNQVRFGKRDSNNSYNISNTIPATNSNYHRIKYIRTDTSVEMYVNDNLKHTETINWLDNYSGYCMQMMRWSQSGTSKLRNVKIKPL